MPQRPLYLDLSQAEVMSRVRPNSALLSSYQAGWEHITLEHFQNQPWEFPEHYFAQHIIVVHLQDLLNSERKLDNRLQTENFYVGEIVLVPSGVNHSLATRQPSNGLLLSLDPQSIAEIAPEAIDPDRVELIPTFPKSDPLIYNIALALKRQLEIDYNDSKLYAETFANALAVHLLKNYSTQQPKFPEYEDGLSQRQLRQTLDYINDSLNSGRQISLSEMAKQLDMSKSYFCQLFERSSKMTPYQYVQQQRNKNELRDRSTLLSTDDGLDPAKLKRVLDFIGDRIGEEIGVREIAQQIDMSTSYFSHQFKKSIGLTPYQYIVQQRIKMARRLLKQRLDLSLADVATECGFTHQSHLGRVFKEYTGITLKQYREDYL